MSTSWSALLQRPASPALDDWFGRIAARLLNATRLLVAGQPHRLVEIEFYYFGEDHLDPFTHRDRLQEQCGRWYLHRSHGSYRSGSFKGIDLTFGDGTARAGVLLRGLEKPDGTLIDGPSLLVDHLLSLRGKSTVAELDAFIGALPAWHADQPLRLVEAAAEDRPLYRTARIGLSLKKAKPGDELFRFLMRRYRYLSEPRRTAKGKLLLVLALHCDGLDAAAIATLTGCPGKTVERYLADHAAGASELVESSYHGQDLGPRELCRLHGAWQTRWGS